MRYVMITVPILFLAALVALAYLLYTETRAQTACVGEQCENLTADELADKVIDARAQ